MSHVHVIQDDDEQLVEASREAVDAKREIEASGGHAAIIEPAPGATEIAATGRPRLARAWVTAWPFVKLGLLGASFAAGGVLLARLAGPRTAHELGERGGEGFAEGVVTAQRRLARVTSFAAGTPLQAPPDAIPRHRGSRWR